MAQLDGAKSFPRPIVTKTGTMKAAFYPAEAYHQDYAFNNPSNMYIVINDAPKVENLKRMFPELYRDKPGAGRGRENKRSLSSPRPASHVRPVSSDKHREAPRDNCARIIRSPCHCLPGPARAFFAPPLTGGEAPERRRCNNGRSSRAPPRQPCDLQYLKH